MIPSSVQRRIAAGLGVLFLAGGTWLAFMGLTLFRPESASHDVEVAGSREDLFHIVLSIVMTLTSGYQI
jgi:threonine/homoserine/homoserine lactone efflux protein